MTLAGQYYPREVLWFKTGVGLATLAERKEGAASKTLSKGVAVIVSGGYDALHRGSLTGSIEATLAAGIYGDGVISQLGISFALSWY